MRTFVRLMYVKKILGGIATSTLYDWISKGYFPPPVKLGPRAIGWDLEDITKWVNERERRDVA